MKRNQLNMIWIEHRVNFSQGSIRLYSGEKFVEFYSRRAIKRKETSAAFSECIQFKNKTTQKRLNRSNYRLLI